MIRVALPQHLRTLARVEAEVLLDGQESPTIAGQESPASGEDETGAPVVPK